MRGTASLRLTPGPTGHLASVRWATGRSLTILAALLLPLVVAPAARAQGRIEDPGADPTTEAPRTSTEEGGASEREAVNEPAREVEEDGSGDGAWRFRAAASGTLLAGDGFSAGGDVRIGARQRWSFDSSSLCSGSSGLYALVPMIASMGMACIPGHVWYGNDGGLDVRARVFHGPDESGGPPAMFAVGLSPELHVSADGRHSFPSILHVILPEVGVTAWDGLDAAFYLELARVPYTYRLADGVGVEARAALWVGRPPWEPEADFDTFAFSFSAGLTFP